MTERPDYHLVLRWRGRVARFQHAAVGQVWRYQARALRDFLDGKKAGT